MTTEIRIERISTHKLTARTEHDPRSGYTTVTPCLVGCDIAFRVSVRVRSHRMAVRLVKAIEAGVALIDVSVQKDLFGNEYLASCLRVRMQSINADLTRLGF